ncbi:hypothetical protein Tco_1197985 [Tanacetum coccineum]
MDEEEVNKRNDLNKEEFTVKISCDTVVEDVADRDTVIEEVIVNPMRFTSSESHENLMRFTSSESHVIH